MYLQFCVFTILPIPPLYIYTGNIGRIVNKQRIVTKYLAQAIATVAANQGLGG